MKGIPSEWQYVAAAYLVFLALILKYIFSVRLGWFPVLGAGRPARTSASSARWAAIMSLMVSIAVTSPREEGVYVPATTGPLRKWTF